MTSSDDQALDETAAIKSLQRDAVSIAKQFEAITKLKPSDPEVLEKLQKALASLTTGPQLAAAVEELKGRGQQHLAALRAARVEAFRRHEADFVRAARDTNQKVREVGGSAWRIGSLELEVQREASRARVHYNRDPVTKWTPIASRADLDGLLATASRALDLAGIAEDALPDVFWDAYEHLRRSHPGAAAAARVPLPEFFREVRVSLARHELRTGKPDRKLTRTELPRWAFLYNLDRYRRLLPALPADRRLSFETGSQHDHQKGLAMVVNGLDAADDYKSYCYVYAAGTK
jgi:hypothetical protein